MTVSYRTDIIFLEKLFHCVLQVAEISDATNAVLVVPKNLLC